MKVNSLNLNNTNCSGCKKQSPAFNGGRNSLDEYVSAFLLEEALLNDRYIPIIKNPAIKEKFEPRQKGKVFGDFIVFDK